MRKLIVLGVLATLGAALLATPASASLDHHFAVIAKAQSGRFVGDNIRVRGNIGRDDNRLSVVGGTKDFNGVAGKLLLHNQGRNGPRQRFHFDLTR